MKRHIALIPCFALAACAPQPNDFGDRTWEVVAVYTDPSTPGGVTTDAAGRAVMAFGPSSLSVQTGCAPLQARAEVSREIVRIEEVELGPLIDDCSGGTRILHTKLTNLLTEGTEFDVRSLGEDAEELVLTVRSEELNRPSIRLVAQ